MNHLYKYFGLFFIASTAFTHTNILRYQYFAEFSGEYSRILAGYVENGEDLAELNSRIELGQSCVQKCLNSATGCNDDRWRKCELILQSIVEKKEQALVSFSTTRRNEFRAEALKAFEPVKKRIDERRLAKNARFNEAEVTVKNEVTSDEPNNKHMVIPNAREYGLTHVITGFDKLGSTFDSRLRDKGFAFAPLTREYSGNTIRAYLTAQGTRELLDGEHLPVIVANNRLYRAVKIWAGRFTTDGHFICSQDLSNAIKHPLWGTIATSVPLLTQVAKFVVNNELDDQIEVTFMELPSGLTSSEIESIQNQPCVKVLRNIIHPDNNIELQHGADNAFADYKKKAIAPSVLEFLRKHPVGNCQMSALACSELLPDLLYASLWSEGYYEPHFAAGYHLKLDHFDNAIVDFNASNHMWNVFYAQQGSMGTIFTVDNAGSAQPLPTESESVDSDESDESEDMNEPAAGFYLEQYINWNGSEAYGPIA